jgi:hypothetical protein
MVTRFECQETKKPLQKGRCVGCRQWLDKAARSAGLTLCLDCYSREHGHQVTCNCELRDVDEGFNQDSGYVPLYLCPEHFKWARDAFGCSFCNLAEPAVLLGSPSGPVYICGECVVIAAKKITGRR